MTESIREIKVETEHEKVIFCSDPSCGYQAIIAIHSTALGPAAGGTRFWNYSGEELALLDALRLSRAMSYKNALAGLPLGGGKSVIIANTQIASRAEIFRAHGRFVESLGGNFITAEDVGTTPYDMQFVREETRYVAGLPGKSGDPSPMTALGVFRALEAAAKHRWGSADLAGRTVALQGCGKTGYSLAEHLHKARANLLVSDIDPNKTKRVVNEFGASAIPPEQIFQSRADIFAPCALGGVINDQTIPQLRVEIIVGSANNQLLEDRDGDLLHEKGILFVPDYVCNSGGVINGCQELLGWRAADCLLKVEGIHEKVTTILKMVEEESLPPHRIADRLASNLISNAKILPADRLMPGCQP